ncbi:MAG: peptidoglycan DL-endopeptidase CwlO [Gaiellales bacterium]|nr:peptidoglycan DL-endopeptidase CwlO [Gaiellales bacterium]
MMDRTRIPPRLRRTCFAIVVITMAATPMVLAAPAEASHSRIPKHVLRMGDTGFLVRKAQRLLHLRADGVFGRDTRGRTKHFQRHHGLLVDGQIGRRTWKALLKSAHQRQRAHRTTRAKSNDGVLQIGDRGRNVRRLQKALRIDVTGVFGIRTHRAVVKFQRGKGLLVDGEAGPQTLGVLGLRARSNHRAVGGRSLGAKVIRITRRYRGIRYTWGGESPRTGFDCSGLVWYVYRQLGITVPRVTYDQWHAGKRIKRSQLRPGDLLFFNKRGHVGIFAGHGWFYHAPRRGSVVHRSVFNGWYRANFDGAVRIGR